MELKSGILRIKNKVTGQCFIACAKTIKDARSLYFHKLTKNIPMNQNLQDDWDEYGKDNFDFEVVERCHYEEVGERKKWWLRHTPYLYNTGLNQAPRPEEVCKKIQLIRKEQSTHHTKAQKVIMATALTKYWEDIHAGRREMPDFAVRPKRYEHPKTVFFPLSLWEGLIHCTDDHMTAVKEAIENIIKKEEIMPSKIKGKKICSCQVDEALYKELKKYCQLQGRKVGWVCAQAVAMYIDYCGKKLK